MKATSFIVLGPSVAVAAVVCGYATLSAPAAVAGGVADGPDHGFNSSTTSNGVIASGTKVARTRKHPTGAATPANDRTRVRDPSIADVTISDCNAPGSQMPGDCVGHVRPCPPVNGKPVHSFVSVTTYTAPKRVVVTPFCPGDTAPGTAAAPPPVTAGVVRASVEKSLPRPIIASAPPPTATALVHVQIITWIKSADGQVPLGSATLLGQHVDFRAHVTAVDWDFGDGSSDTSNGPGRAYDFDVNPCRDYLCPGYFGHVYTKAARVTVTARATWFAQFRVGGGAWQNVGAVQGTTGQLPLTIHSAHTVLVR